MFYISALAKIGAYSTFPFAVQNSASRHPNEFGCFFVNGVLYEEKEKQASA